MRAKRNPFFYQVFFFLDWVKYLLNNARLFKSFLRITLTCVITIGTLALGLGTASGYISPWTGRFYSLLDPTYAKDHIPIIASVSEHQPTAWSSFMFDFHILLFLFPAGLYFCFKRLSDATRINRTITPAKYILVRPYITINIVASDRCLKQK